MKRAMFLLLGILLLSPLIFAQDYKMEISTVPEDKIVGAGESIHVLVKIWDEYNNIISDIVQLRLEDLKENLIEEKSIQSNTFEEIKIPDNAVAGEGKIIATYKEKEVSESFFVSPSEKA